MASSQCFTISVSYSAAPWQSKEGEGVGEGVGVGYLVVDEVVGFGDGVVAGTTHVVT